MSSSIQTGLCLLMKWAATLLKQKDGNIRGETCLCTKEGQPQNHTATKDVHFIMLAFTAANGEPIMRTLIFFAKATNDEWNFGFDPVMEWIGVGETTFKKIWARARHIQWD
jgi:hypothetical protein